MKKYCVYYFSSIICGSFLFLSFTINVNAKIQFDEKSIQEALEISPELHKKWIIWKNKKQEQFLLYAAKHLDPDEILLFQELPLDVQWKIIVKLQKGFITDAKTYLLAQITLFKDNTKIQ